MHQKSAKPLFTGLTRLEMIENNFHMLKNLLIVDEKLNEGNEVAVLMLKIRAIFALDAVNQGKVL